MKNLTIPAVVLCVIFAHGCKERDASLFRLVPSDESGIAFVNEIKETDSFNILTHEYIYNGGGVGAGDFNNDGSTDLFFSGNTVSNKLYLNQGNLEFKDVTDAAGVAGNGQWCSGVALADINSDGWLDIYVCSTFKNDSTQRKNLLYINQGAGNDGSVSFSEEAAAYGVDDDGYSTTAAFLDYDNDGDLDLYVLTNILNERIPTSYRAKITDGSALNNDRLYRNNGNGTFTNVSVEAGITYEGYGLGLAVADFNEDGWQDIYVSNDYLSNDILYVNQQDGTFRNETSSSIRHQSMFSMGNDAADFNNDGHVDVITLDMLGETNYRQKTTMGSKNYLTYINNEKYGYDYQYIRNMLQTNNGTDENGNVSFSEVGLMANIYQTDWSWSPLFVDIDNDGWKDLLVTNGFPKDVTDRDFSNYRSMTHNLVPVRLLLDSIPSAKVPNYAFRNNGDMTFEDVTTKWGLSIASFSNGAAFCDLDNDGDLDYVVNNINDKAFVFENRLYGPGAHSNDTANYIRFKLIGGPQNRSAIGATVRLYDDHGQEQLHVHSTYRGYISTVEDIVHFGLGKHAVDSVKIFWADGSSTELLSPAVNQLHTVAYAEPDDAATAVQVRAPGEQGSRPTGLVREVSDALGLDFRHREDDIIDFHFQRTLPHKFSQYGPGIAVGDLNNDGLDDFVIGGGSDVPRYVYTQRRDGTFSVRETAAKPEEDMGLLLFDADQDTDLDLYVATGSMEHEPSSAYYQDKLYVNDGKGNFLPAEDALPTMIASSSCVRGADFDHDGDIDLFVGGRVSAQRYPMPGQSFLLENNKGTFRNITDEAAPGLGNVGMVTDALWTDYDNDGNQDLVVVGEFMTIKTFRNQDGKLLLQAENGLESKNGWWNSIVAGDFDRDGDTDYVAGNLGLNNIFHASAKEPLTLIAKDFDNNGSIDPVLSCYFRESLDSDERRIYPLHFWDELFSQSPRFRKQFVNYKHYGRTGTDVLLTEKDREDALVLKANYFYTSYVENLGNGKFEARPLPSLTQVAPVNGMIVEDVNGDGFLDVLMVGNDFGNEIFVGRYDAFSGIVLIGDGTGEFTPVECDQSDFLVAGDAKAAAKLYNSDRQAIYLISQNRDALKVFSRTSGIQREFVELRPDDAWVEFEFADGRKQKTEHYLGAGYLSQSTSKIAVPPNVQAITIVGPGLKRRAAEPLITLLAK